MKSERVLVEKRRVDAERIAQLDSAAIDEEIESLRREITTLKKQRNLQKELSTIYAAQLLLDEFSAHLDQETKQQVTRNLQSMGVTIIAVTHDPWVLKQADLTLSIPG